MSDKVRVFFYGSYINRNVLREVDLVPESVQVARLFNHDIEIRPLANLVKSEGRCVYGILIAATHEELSRLYDHARDVLGGVYLPEAVLVETSDGTWHPSLCYICHDMTSAPPRPDYVDRIVMPARKLGFPDWYIGRLEKFRP